MSVAEINRRYADTVERALERELAGPEGSSVLEAMRYSALGGGKRIRACLALGVCEMTGGRAEDAVKYACAVEMVHAYSLIHDDLPCMDNDDMRRGKPSCHVAFSEGTALLAGDALLTHAFETAAGAGLKNDLRAVAVLAGAAGIRGMVYGQELDTDPRHTVTGEDELRRIHLHKTGALIKCAAVLGALAADADDASCEAVSGYAEALGMVFQIVDDILDVTSTAEVLGKPVGSDEHNGKLTYVGLLGVDGARGRAAEITERAKVFLRPFGDEARYLCELADNLLKRMN